MDGETTIEINGKTVGIDFNIVSQQEMGDVKGLYATDDAGNPVMIKEVLEDGTEIERPKAKGIQSSIAMVWGGIVGWAFKKRIDPPITFGEIVDWIGEATITGDDKEAEKITSVLKAYETSDYYQKLTKKK